MSANSETGTRRKAFLAVLAVFLLILAGDILSPPDRQLGARGAVFGIYVYQYTYGKLLSILGVSPCKFKPSCSNYGLLAFKKYGTFRGSYLTTRRLLRCSPFSSARGEDWP